MTAVNLVLSRLESFCLRESGRDRWRSCCPAHEGKNPSALSIGVGREEQVLLRCWHGCTVEEVVEALGLELTDLFPPRPPSPGGGSSPIRRRRLISASQALELLEHEMLVAIVVDTDLAGGQPLTDAMRERLVQGAARVSMLRAEVRA